MKTPRQLLLDRHRSVEAQLDDVRRATVEGLEQRRRRASVANECRATRGSLRDLLLSLRWHCVGLSGAWLIVVLLNVDRSPSVAPQSTAIHRSSALDLFSALQENRRQLLKLIELPSPELPPARRSAVPQRRGELRSDTLIA